ncbi:MAG: hypothetical protein WCV50_04510 [Patescibacteria group bacterium]|jgi:hypothetical protein
MNENFKAIEDWIAQARTAGLSDNQISDQLRNSGWQESQIAQFIKNEVSGVSHPGTPARDYTFPVKGMKNVGTSATELRQKPWLLRHTALLFGVLGGILIIGGTAFAAVQGYIQIPFISNSNKLLTQAIKRLETVESGEFGIVFSIATEPRTPDAVPWPKNSNIDEGMDDFSLDFTDMIPADVALEGVITTFMNTDSADLQKLRGILTAKGSYRSSGTTMSMDLEARIVDGLGYLLVRQFPALPFVDTSPFVGKWISLNTKGDSTADDFLSAYTPDNVNVSEESKKVKIEAAAIFRLALSTKALSAANSGSEKLDGHATKKITLTINPEKIPAFLAAYRDDADKRGVSTAYVDETLQELKDPKYLELIRAMASNLRITVWIDSADHTPRKAEYSQIIVPDETATNFKDKQIHATFGFTLDHVNEQPNVEAPKDAVTLETVLEPVLAGPRAKSRNAQRKSDIGQLRTALILYYDDNTHYPKDINEVAEKPNQTISQMPVPPLPNEIYAYTPTEDLSGFTICATLEDVGEGAGKYCYDQAGILTETPGNSLAGPTDLFSEPGQRNEKRLADLKKLREGVLLFYDYENQMPKSYTDLLRHTPPVIEGVAPPVQGEMYKYTLLDGVKRDFSVCADFENSVEYEAGQYCFETAKPNALIQKGVNGGIDIEIVGDYNS